MMWRNLQLITLAGTAILLAALGGGAMLLLDRAESGARLLASQSLERTAHSVENLLNRQILQVDGALASLPNLLAPLGPDVTPAQAQALLRGLNFQSFAFRNIFLVEADGGFWATSRGSAAGRPLPVSTAELRSASAPGALSVAGPVRDRVTGDWSLYLARTLRIAARPGILAVAEMPVPNIVQLLGETVTGPGTRIALTRRDGRLIASLPHDEMLIGRAVGTPLDEGRRIGKVFEPAVGDMDTMAVVRSTLYDDLVVLVTADTKAALASWSRDKDRVIAVGAALAVLLVAFASALLGLLRQRDRLAAEREKASAVLEDAIEAMADGFVMWDEDDRFVTCNQRYRELYSVSSPFLVKGALFSDIIRKGVEAGQYPQAEGNEAAFLDRTVQWHHAATGTLERLLPDGRWLLITERQMAHGGIVGIRTDITAIKAAEARISFLAHHDDLTGLPNRVMFRAQMDELLPRAAMRGEDVALLYLDLDRFKDVNDTLGHPTGDRLLEIVASRLLACIGEDAIASRLGGDEFAVIMPRNVAREDAAALAARLIAALSEPCDIFGRTVAVGASVGIAFAAEAGGDPETLLQNADLALYHAKTRARGTYCVFEAELARQLRSRLELETDLAGALDRGELEVAYQPIHDLRLGRICGFEALLRWNHRTRGRISPAEFVPIAEESGLIRTIGPWVLRRACLDVAPLPGNLKIAVNLSPVQLRGRDILGIVSSALAESGLDPSRLELEITETALLENNDRTVALLGDLRALGPSIVLDDFGTGFSSLSHLKNFPLSKIKIDQSFVRETTTRPDSVAIVTSLVGLADKLGMTTTAEGIETPEQLETVRAAGCSEVQGYLLGRPGSILEAVALLARNDDPPAARRTLRARRG